MSTRKAIKALSNRGLARIFSLVFSLILAFGFNGFFAFPSAATTVVSTSPAIDGTIALSPNFVTVTADQNLLDFGNQITVISPSNTRVDDGLLTVSGKTLSVGMSELVESGKYLVEYELLVENEEPLFGNFSFTFQAPPSLSQPSPQPSTNTQGGSENQEREIGSELTDYLVIGLLVFAFLVLMWLARFARTTFRKD
jgi:methionine-rich copper-binding protein CopC